MAERTRHIHGVLTENLAVGAGSHKPYFQDKIKCGAKETLVSHLRPSSWTVPNVGKRGQRTGKRLDSWESRSRGERGRDGCDRWGELNPACLPAQSYDGCLHGDMSGCADVKDLGGRGRKGGGSDFRESAGHWGSPSPEVGYNLRSGRDQGSGET